MSEIELVRAWNTGISEERKNSRKSMIQDWFMASAFHENASFTATPVTGILWGDPNLMFNVKKSLFSSACICITAITVRRSYRHRLRREYTPHELSLVWLLLLFFFFNNVMAKWFLYFDSKPGGKKCLQQANLSSEVHSQFREQLCLYRLPGGIQLLGPQALPPLLSLALPGAFLPVTLKSGLKIAWIWILRMILEAVFSWSLTEFQNKQQPPHPPR